MDIDIVIGSKGYTSEEMENIIEYCDKSKDKKAMKIAFENIKKRLLTGDLIWQGSRMGFGSASVSYCVERDHCIVDKEEIGYSVTI